jgi:hypothetical protein
MLFLAFSKFINISIIMNLSVAKIKGVSKIGFNGDAELL